MAKTLRPAVAPNLPIAPVDYSQQYQDQYSNALRLYFTALDNFTFALMTNSGGRYISEPHLYASNTATRYADGDNTPTTVEWNTVVASEGFTLDTATDAGVPVFNGSYRVDYRLQAENSDTNPHELYVWLVVDGDDVANSCTKFTIPANTGADSYIVCASFIETDILGGNSIQLFWATDKAATSGGGLGVYLESYPAQVSPFPAPAIPSSYGSITFVSELSE